MSTKYTIITIISSIIYFFTCLTTISLMFFSACGLTIYFIYKTQFANNQTINLEGKISFYASKEICTSVSLLEETPFSSSTSSIYIQPDEPSCYEMALNDNNSSIKVEGVLYYCKITIINESTSDLFVDASILPSVGSHNSYLTMQFFKNATEFLTPIEANEVLGSLDMLVYEIVISAKEDIDSSEIENFILAEPLYINWVFNLSPQI